ncbi:hypothetical protein M5689_009882 [Euphorbia peplus]|nr:hypothetical protein M5689_009882 [Euphorbia peplus]
MDGTVAVSLPGTVVLELIWTLLLLMGRGFSRRYTDRTSSMQIFMEAIHSRDRIYSYSSNFSSGGAHAQQQFATPSMGNCRNAYPWI